MNTKPVAMPVAVLPEPTKEEIYGWYKELVEARNQDKKQRDAMHSALLAIMNANTSTWEDPTQFKPWAQNIARNALLSK